MDLGFGAQTQKIMNKKLLNYIQIALTLALIVFIFLKAGEFFEKVDWNAIASNWPSVIIAGVIFTLGYVFMAQHWAFVCRIITTKTGKKQWLAFFASQPYKYLPTSIFTFSSRATFAKRLGMDFRQSTEAQVLENINLIGTAIIIGFLFLLLQYNFLYALALTVLAGLIGLAVWTKDTVTIPKLKVTIDLKKWLVSLSIVSAGWLIMGLGFFILVVGLENRIEPVLPIAANSLATGFGIMAVFAPGGIGVRELIFSYLSFASGTILTWRLTTFVVDILVGVWAGWTISRQK